MSWSISTPRGAGNFSAFGITNAKRHLVSLGIDTFTFSAPYDITAMPICFWGDYVVIRNGSVIWFQGICTKPTGQATGPAEMHHYEISGAWWWLDNIVLQCPWRLADASQQNKGRVILGVSGPLFTITPGLTPDQLKELQESYQAEDPTPGTIGDDIFNCISWAQGCGAPVALGLHAIAAFAPPKEVLDVTIGEAIRSRCKYAPDVVSWLNYASSPPTLNFQYRAALSAVSVSLTAISGPGLTITPRNDLVPPAVVICYEITNNIDGKIGINISADKYPTGASGLAPRTLVSTIPLKGVEETYVRQKIRVATMTLRHADGVGSDITDTNADFGHDNDQKHVVERFLLSRVPSLQRCDTVSGVNPKTPDLKFIKLASGKYFDSALQNVVGNDGTGDYYLVDASDPSSAHVHLDASLDKCLLEGTVLPWMGADAQFQRITFRVQWKENKVVTGIDSDHNPGVTMSFDLTATDAASATYTNLASFTGGSGVPTGLAQNIFASLATLQYEGRAALTEAECSGTVAPGVVMNITGGRPEWLSMRALMQQLEENIDTGESTVMFGPPHHLAPQDIIELMRAGRPPEWDTRNRAASAPTRQSGLI